MWNGVCCWGVIACLIMHAVSVSCFSIFALCVKLLSWDLDSVYLIILLTSPSLNSTLSSRDATKPTHSSEKPCLHASVQIQRQFPFYFNILTVVAIKVGPLVKTQHPLDLVKSDSCLCIRLIFCLMFILQNWLTADPQPPCTCWVVNLSQSITRAIWGSCE